MRFEDQPESSNVEDRRGDSPSYGGGNPFGGMRLPIGRGGLGGLGLGGLLVLLLVGWFAGIDPLQLLNGNVVPSRSAPSTPSSRPRATAGEEQLRSFVARVLATTETCWRDLFPRSFARDYENPTLVLFRNGVNSACGSQSSSVGPFYCPGDRKLYIDLSFLEEMGRTLGAAGDFAQAYVVAHEVGHHVQNLIGTSRKVDAVHGSAADRNHASVLLELQADYYAGVWAHYVNTKLRGKVDLDPGDYEEAIRAAQAVGDDVLQKRATGQVVPEKFTHGTAAQRSKWFRLGFETGDPKAHDPFVEEK
jgi:predicted metalloprotease